jgi:hypothetical protein
MSRTVKKTFLIPIRHRRLPCEAPVFVGEWFFADAYSGGMLGCLLYFSSHRFALDHDHFKKNRSGSLIQSKIMNVI